MHDVEIVSDLVFSETDGIHLMADLYIPVADEPVPVALYVHGGGFQFGSRGDDGPNRIRVLAAHGVAVLSVDYRLAPDGRHPDQLNDLRAAVRWLRGASAASGIDSRRIDTRRVGVVGASAGGLLAALLGLAPGEKADTVQAVVALFPMTDLIASASRSDLETNIFPFAFEAALLGAENLGQLRDDEDVRRRALDASPVHWVREDAPPFLLAHGDRDRITPEAQSRLLHDALVRVGADSTLVTVGGAGHEDAKFDSAGQLALTAGWLRAVLSDGD